MKSHLPHVNSHRSLLVIIIIIILLTFPQRLQPAATHSKKKISHIFTGCDSFIPLIIANRGLSYLCGY